MDKDGLTLTVGAAGDFAGLVIPELVKRGARVRGLVHDPKDSAKAKERGAQEVAVGDLADPQSLTSALKGVRSVFYLAPKFGDEVANGKNMVAACIEAGVRRFVFSSVIHPVLSALENHIEKGPVESAVLESDMEYTFLHPGVFFQNFAAGWKKVAESGVHAEPYSADTRFSRVDYRDVAEAAAIALTEDRLLYGTFELVAEGWTNRRDVAKLMGEALERPVDVGTTKIEDALPPKAPDNIKAGLKKMFQYYDRHGLLGNALTLRAVLGREPRTLNAYFDELASVK